jgi:hypothetical protein
MTEGGTCRMTEGDMQDDRGRDEQDYWRRDNPHPKRLYTKSHFFANNKKTDNFHLNLSQNFYHCDIILRY